VMFLIAALCFEMLFKFWMAKQIRSTVLSDFSDGCKSIIDFEDYYVAWGFNSNLTVGTFKDSPDDSPCYYLRGKSDEEIKVLPENLESVDFDLNLFKSLGFEIGVLIVYIYTLLRLARLQLVM
jgi:hypothetical protein